MISIIWHESGHAPVLSIAVGEMHVTPGVAEELLKTNICSLQLPVQNLDKKNMLTKDRDL